MRKSIRVDMKLSITHRGSAFGFGVEYGKMTAKQIHAALKIARVYWPRIGRASWKRLVEAGLKLVPYAQKFSREYMDEVRGMAQGAGVPFDELWLMNVEEEVVDRRLGLSHRHREPGRARSGRGNLIRSVIPSEVAQGGTSRGIPPLPLTVLGVGRDDDRKVVRVLRFARNDSGHCTTIAVRSRSQFVLAHNEDWTPQTTVPFPVVTVRRTSLPSFISVAYPGALPGSVCGVNSAGIAFNENSLELPARRGVPKNFIKRALLDAKNIRQVRRILATKPQALSCNFVCVSAAEGVAASYEITQAGVFTLPMRARPLVHTNHILHLRARTRTEKPARGSFSRFEATSAMLAATPALTPVQLHRILLHPDVFRKGRRPHESATVATILITVSPRGKSALSLTHHLVKGKPRATFSLSRVPHFYT